MHTALKGKRKTGNKTVKAPGGMSASEEASRGGVDTSKGYKKLSAPGVLESPHHSKKK